MPCDTQLLPRQTISQRKEEIKKAISKLSQLLASKKVKPVIGPQGAVAFSGWEGDDRSRVTDACAYRQIMVHGSALAKAAIARAEQLSGRSVNKQAVGQGAHSHDGGKSWHSHKG